MKKEKERNRLKDEIFGTLKYVGENKLECVWILVVTTVCMWILSESLIEINYDGSKFVIVTVGFTLMTVWMMIKKGQERYILEERLETLEYVKGIKKNDKTKM